MAKKWTVIWSDTLNIRPKNRNDFPIILSETRKHRLNEEAKEYFSKGIAACNEKKYSIAIRLFSQVIKIKPTFAEAYFNRGLSFYYINKYDNAIVDYTRAIELNPCYKKAYAKRGIAYDFKGESDKARSDYLKGRTFEDINNTKPFQKNKVSSQKEKSEEFLDYRDAPTEWEEWRVELR